jgi:quinol-cytochrome oxidoreductase complex cytochrome b subunit
MTGMRDHRDGRDLEAPAHLSGDPEPVRTNWHEVVALVFFVEAIVLLVAGALTELILVIVAGVVAFLLAVFAYGYSRLVSGRDV